MDQFQERAIASHRSRHEETIRAAAARIQEYAGYILRDLDAGRTSGRYAGDIFMDAQALVTRFAMLEAMSDVTGIMATEE